MAAKIHVNPFENYIVTEPRRVDKSIADLNIIPLEKLIKQFETLEAGQPPRKSKLAVAQFVVSPQPGYGKSHLIGRLFRQLNCRATRIYIRPFEDSVTCWKSILLNMVKELKFPDNVEKEYCSESEPTQLEAFAHGVLSKLTAELIASKHKESTAKNFLTMTVAEFRNNKPLCQWVHQNFSILLQHFTSQLPRHGIELYANSKSWLNVLFTLAYFPDKSDLRIACEDWLKGGSIDPNEAKQIGIQLSDIPNYEMSGSEINQICKYRVQDFCQLAGFFRPFLFCFDQTENYGKDISLSKTFGLVIQLLADETVNQMTVVTANQSTWEKSVKVWWEDASRERLSPQLELEGLNFEQSKELIQYRFEDGNSDKHTVQEFYKNDFPSSLFKETQQLGIREFLKLCSARWQFIVGKITPPSPIEDYYQKCVAEINTQRQRLVFDRDTLYWLISEGVRNASNIKTEKYTSQRGYFVLLWKTTDREIYFGFESESHWKRWEAILKESKIHHIANPRSTFVLFRTSELPEIPSSRWQIAPQFEEAKKQYFQIVNLNTSELEKIYAAHDLFLDSVEGNIPYERKDVLEFLAKELQWFWDRILTLKNDGSPITPPIDPPPSLIQEIRKIVSTHKFMSVEECIKKLSKPVTVEEFHIARGHISEIRIYVHTKMTVLQWQSNK